MKKILFIQPNFDINRPRDIRTENIVKKLQEDYEISILSFNCYAPKKNIKSVSIIRQNYSFLSKYIVNKNIYGYEPKGIIRFLSRGVSYILKKFLFPDVWILEKKNQLNFFKKNLSHIEYDCIIASILPFTNASLAIDIKNKFCNNAKVILDIGDPLSFNSANSNRSQGKKLNYEKNVLHNCDHVIVTNEPTKEYYIRNFNIPRNKISIIPQGVNLDIFKYNSGNKKQQDIISLVYAGTFYKSLRDPSNFFKALDKATPNFKVDIYGGIYKCKNKSVTFKNNISQNELVKAYENSDAILYFDNAFGIQTSGKIFELLALKKDILFIYDNESSPVLSYARKYPNIHLIKNTERSILEFLNHFENEIKPENTYNYDVELFSWNQRANKFNTIIKQQQASLSI